MNLHRLLLRRAAEGRPVRVGLIGAGKFGSMFLAQARTTAGLHLMAVADLSPERARAAMRNTHWPDEQAGARSFEEARTKGTTHLTDDAAALIAAGGIEVVVDATGIPAAGVRHVLLACEHGRHIVMVNVEADALAGPLLARRAERAGIVYSLAYGDQPALICEMVDWARASGFGVVAAGKGTRYLPRFHDSTPEVFFRNFGIDPEVAKAAGMNPKMTNSFVDGTKSAVEMTAVSNATGLAAPTSGLGFPPCGVHDLARLLIPRQEGGVLERPGQVEVISSLERDGREVVGHLQMGVYVVIEAEGDYVRRCFKEYRILTDDSGHRAALWRPWHFIGLEVGISVAAAALRGEPTGVPEAFNADVVAVAKKDLAAGEMLDGEGGYTVWGRIMPASDSLALGALPMGLAHDVPVTRDIPKGTVLTAADVRLDEESEVVRIRREMERGLAS
jgi:predicted homoserine dehydrogenase-like protein